MKLSKYLILAACLCFSFSAYATGVRLNSANWVVDQTEIMRITGNLITVDLPRGFYMPSARPEFSSTSLRIPFRGCYSPPVGRIDGTRNPHGGVVTPITISIPGWENFVRPLSGPVLNGGNGCLSGQLMIPKEKIQRNVLPKNGTIVLHGPGRNVTLRFRINLLPPTSSPMLHRFNRTPPK